MTVVQSSARPRALTPAGARAAPAASTSTNTIEDTFTRANQTGWGTTTNPDGVPNVAWGMDGSGAKTSVTISNYTVAAIGTRPSW